MEWYLKVVRANYANFNGRASRQEYWMFFLFNIIFAFVAIFADTFLFLGLGFLHLLYLLAVFIPGLAVAVRRLHDVGKSGWWLLSSILILPILLLIYWAIIEGDANPNEYGEVPTNIIVKKGNGIDYNNY